MGLALIERYIFRKALVAFLTAAGGLIGVLWIVRAVQEVDVVMNKGQGISTYLKMTTLGVPTLAAAVAPLALLIGLLQVIKALNQDSELVVMHASGASRVSLLKPFVALSLLVAALVYFLHLWAGPASMQTLRSYVTTMRADLVSVVVREGKFQDVGSGLTFHVDSRAPGGVLKGVFILDGRSDKETFTYLAKEGNVTKVDANTYLVLSDGQIQRLENKTKSLSVIRFNSYAFNLSSFSGTKSAKAGSQMEIPTLELLNPTANDSFYKMHPERYRSELHTRFTGGLYPLMVGMLVLAYFGNPSSHRQGQTVVAVTACTVILCLRGLTIVGEGALRAEPAMVYVVWGVPIFAIAVSAFLLATDRSAFPPDLLVRVENILHQLSLRLEPLRNRLLGYGRRAEVAT